MVVKLNHWAETELQESKELQTTVNSFLCLLVLEQEQEWIQSKAVESSSLEHYGGRDLLKVGCLNNRKVCMTCLFDLQLNVYNFFPDLCAQAGSVSASVKLGSKIGRVMGITISPPARVAQAGSVS